jgi:hypothetical protein
MESTMSYLFSQCRRAEAMQFARIGRPGADNAPGLPVPAPIRALTRVAYASLAILAASAAAIPAAAKTAPDPLLEVGTEAQVVSSAAIEVSRQPYQAYFQNSDCGGSYTCEAQLPLAVGRKQRLEITYISCESIVDAAYAVSEFRLRSDTKDGQVLLSFLPSTYVAGNSAYKRFLSQGQIRFVVNRGDTLNTIALSTNGIGMLLCFVSGDLVRFE